MKRAGKVFLALTLVLAMLWTSTGTSNVPGVLAENVASMQSAKDNKEAVKATTEEGLGFTGTGEGISSQAITLLTEVADYCYDNKRRRLLKRKRRQRRKLRQKRKRRKKKRLLGKRKQNLQRLRRKRQQRVKSLRRMPLRQQRKGRTVTVRIRILPGQN